MVYSPLAVEAVSSDFPAMRTVFIPIVAALLTGCGGGQSSGPEFVPLTIDDFVGETFAFRYAAIDGGTATRGTGSIRVEDLETLTITRDGTTTTFAAVSPDVFEASDGSGGTPYFDLVSMMGFPIRDADDRLVAIGFYGFETTSHEMPSTGSLTYEGLSGLFVDLDGTVSSASGTSSLRADFGTQTVVGTLFDNIGSGGEFEARLTLRQAKISGQQITGRVRLVDEGTFAGATLSNTSAEATFYGYGARGIAGTFAADITQGSNAGVLTGAVSATNR